MAKTQTEEKTKKTTTKKVKRNEEMMSIWGRF